MHRIVPSIAALLLVGCGGNPFSVEAKVAALCQHLPAQRFEVSPEARAQFALVPPEARTGMEFEKDFIFNVANQTPPELKDLAANFALTSVKLTAVEDGEHLGYFGEAHLRLHPGANSAVAQRQFDYVRTEAAPKTVTWNGDAVDIGTYIDADGNLSYSVGLVGDLPPNDLVVDIDACAEATVKFDYL